MRLTTIAAFGIGYVVGTRAGREQFDRLAAWADRGITELKGSDLQDRLEGYASSLEKYANRPDDPLNSVTGLAQRRTAQ
jgi:hypothetical protein